jgi:hypothetical protein
MKKIFTSQKLKNYRTSLRGVRKHRLRLQHKLKTLGVESDDAGNLVYKVELLRVIETTFMNILAGYDKRFFFKKYTGLAAK